MGKTLCVGNLSFTITEPSLHALFSLCGEVRSCRVVVNRASGHSRGIAFIEMSSVREAKHSVERLNGHEIEGRRLSVRLGPPRHLAA